MVNPGNIDDTRLPKETSKIMDMLYGRAAVCVYATRWLAPLCFRLPISIRKTIFVLLLLKFPWQE